MKKEVSFQTFLLVNFAAALLGMFLFFAIIDTWDGWTQHLRDVEYLSYEKYNPDVPLPPHGIIKFVKN